MTTIKSIQKNFSNEIRIPYTLCTLDCGHTIEMMYADSKANKHDQANWLYQVGQQVSDCAACAANEVQLAKIIDFARTPDFSHITLRDLTAGKTGEWMTFCVYRKDEKSPTGCCIELRLERTGETEAALIAAGLSFVHGPSRGNNIY